MHLAPLFLNTGLVWLAFFFFYKRGQAPTLAKQKYFFIVVCLSLNFLLVTGLIYFLTPSYLNYIEVAVADISEYWTKNHPLYTEVLSQDRYSILYGPWLFIANGFIQMVGFATIQASKLFGFLNLLTSLGMCWFLLGPKLKPKDKVMGLGLISLVFLGFNNFSYVNRADSFLIAYVLGAFCLLEIDSPSPLPLIFISALIGLSTATKIHGFVYFLPAVIFYFEKNQKNISSLSALGTVLGIFTLGAAFSLLPFLLPSVSFENYFLWLRSASKHGLSFKLFAYNLSYCIPYILALYFCGFTHRYKFTFVSFCLSLFAASIFGCLVGGGAYHLLPLLAPIMIFVIRECFLFPEKVNGVSRVFLTSFFIALLYDGLISQKVMINYFREIPVQIEQVSEIKKLQEKYQGPMELGYGDNSQIEWSYYSPYVLAHGGSLIVENSALMDMGYSGLEIPQKTFDALENCLVPIFILPRGENPWRAVSGFGLRLFSERWIKVFSKNYKPLESTHYYTVYKCQ